MNSPALPHGARLTRRSFIQRSCVSAAGLVVGVPLLDATLLGARGNSPPRRLVVLFTPNSSILANSSHDQLIALRHSSETPVQAVGALGR